MRSTPPFLIVGQGLAGSLMAHALDRLGADFSVIDPGGSASASRIAAGLLNPFTGPRYKAPQPAEVWFRSALANWRLLEQRLDLPLLHTGPLLRLIRDEQEREHVQRRSTETTGGLLRLRPAPAESGLAAPQGCAEIQAGQVNLPIFLDATRNWLSNGDRLINDHFRPDDVSLGAAGPARWKNNDFTAIIACAGYRTRQWPWFADLPWRMSHGQALILKRRPEFGPYMLSRGKNLIPLDAQRCWLGATYDRHTEPTLDQDGRNQLLAALDSLFQNPSRTDVLNHVAGVRAGNREGFLFCGRHPGFPALVLFGGLGSRGTLMAPAAAAALASHLVNGTALPGKWALDGYLDRGSKP